MLALLDNGARPPGLELGAGMALLSRWQQENGLLSDTPQGLPNLAFNGLACLVLRRMREQSFVAASGHEHVETKLLAGIQATKGIKTEPSEVMRQDNGLQGWPWMTRRSAGSNRRRGACSR